tara:strand:- start:1360 stop:2019 length:660 start_codon:yes stop_codon:yes gene_type:complete
MNKLMKLPEKQLAVELFASQPNMTVSEIAIQVGVTPKTMSNWRQDPKFIDAIYERYMELFGAELPAVLNAMIREGKSGNVQAARLVLEHSGKLVKNVNVTVQSPFEKWLKKVDDVEVVEGEIVENDLSSLMDKIPVIENIELPERKVESQVKRKRNEIQSLNKAKKKAAYNLKQKEWNRWKKRAKDVELAPLKGGRPTKGQRLAWEQEIIRRENEKKDS